jgi:glutathione S-transferase
MLRLYQAPNSICTQKVLITLREKRLEYETRNLDLFRNEQYTPAYLRINPKGVVPSLEHDGRIVVESTLICEYLDDVFPSPRLIPEDPYLRTQMRLWTKSIDEGIFEATREISFSAMFREKMRTMSAEQRETRFRNVGDPQRRARYLSTFELGVDSPYVLQGIAAYEKLFASMEKALSGLGAWVLGEAFTLGDIALMPFIARLHYLGLLELWTLERPAVQGWWARARVCPSFLWAVHERLTETDIAAMRKSGANIREQVRSRRTAFLAESAAQ